MINIRNKKVNIIKYAINNNYNLCYKYQKTELK